MSSDEERNSPVRGGSDDEDAPVSRTKRVAQIFDDSDDSDDGERPPAESARSGSSAAAAGDDVVISDSEEEAAPRKRTLKRKSDRVMSDEDDDEDEGDRGRSNADTRKDVFGSDSEEDEEPRSKKKAKRRQSDSEGEGEGVDEDELTPVETPPPRKRTGDVFSDSEDEEIRDDQGGYDSEGGFIEDEEQPLPPVESKRGKKQKGEGKKKKKSRGAEEGDGDEEQPEDNKPKSILKQTMEEEKAKRLAKRAVQDEQAVENHVVRVIGEMKNAAELDREANLNKRPGINKLKMLPLVVKELKIKGDKRGRRDEAEVLDRQELYIENGVLLMIAEWLNPLPDKSLPSVQIRAAMLEALDDLPIERHRDELRESTVGHKIMMLSKHPKETFENKQRCQNLITKWSRQICGLSTDYRALSRDERREIAKREQEEYMERRQRALAMGAQKTSIQRRESIDSFDGTSDLTDALGSGQRAPKPGEAGWRRHASVPKPTGKDYFVSPMGDEAPSSKKKSKQGTERMTMLQRRAKDMKQKSKMNPLTKLSVEGRGL